MRQFKHVLVTGGAGFIGSHLVKYLNLHTDWKISVLDSLTYAGNLENLDGCKYEFLKTDISDEAAMTALWQYKFFDCVIHLAAESHVDNSIENPNIFVKTNVNGTLNLLNASLHWHKLNPNFVFYHVSTDEVFGSLPLNGKKKFNEKTSYNPRSPYSASKASSDHFVRAYGNTFKLPVIISNCSNNYGTHQYHEKLIPTVVSRILNGESIPVYGKGDNIRDWLHVEDHCSAIKLLLEEGELGETYCIGGNDAISNLALIRLICGIYEEITGDTKSYELITFVEDRKGHDQRYEIDFSKIQHIGWEPKQHFVAGLRETVEWYRAQHLINIDIEKA